MTNNLADKIREKYPRPLIAVIGATNPSKEYTDRIGIAVGYQLRGYVGREGGTIFTGGVEGVGVDVYVGVMQYCLNVVRSGEKGQLSSFPNDHFFVLIPQTSGLDILLSGKSGGVYDDAYYPPSGYTALGKLTKRGSLDAQRGGQTLADRRRVLSHLADVVVMVNGGGGTLDEGVTAVCNSKPVIALSYSGGAARVLSAIRNGSIAPHLQKILRAEGIDPAGLDHNLIREASSLADLEQILDSLRIK